MQGPGLQGLLVPVLSLLGPWGSLAGRSRAGRGSGVGADGCVGTGHLWSLPLQTLVPEWRARASLQGAASGSVGRPGKGQLEQRQLSNPAGGKVTTEASGQRSA